MFTCHNAERGELSETDSITGAMVAAYTHLMEDGEKAPISIFDDDRKPVAVVSWMPVGSRSVVRVGLLEDV